jgi:hypothetical protein
MKYIKLTIILLVVAGSLGCIINLITKGKVSGDIKPGSTDIKTKTIEKRIHDEIESASNNSFCVATYTGILNDIDLYFKNEPSNKATYTLKLQGAYCRKFVQQANYVFDGTSWEPKKITTIHKEMKRCLEFFPEDQGLDSIRNILSEYDRLAIFNGKVNKACQQEPKCVGNPLFLYKTDDWDVKNTKKLLNDIPNPIGKVRNSPLYQNTRKTKISERLKKAHTNFIQQKMDRSKIEAESYTPRRQYDYRCLGEYLYKCFNSYRNLWNSWDSSNRQWQKDVENWGKYVEPLN